jgi:prevent-host-death family protein
MNMPADLVRRRFGQTLDRAEEEPVFITWHGRKRYVLMSAAEYEVLLRAWSAQREQKTLLAAESAIDKLLRGDQETGTKLLRIANSLMKRMSEEDAK